jgi:hypothetical protein
MLGLLLALVAQVAQAATATSVSQFGITWTFNQAYEIGQYANGDYWVVGPVTVNSVTPAPSTGRHGSVINPLSGGNQGYDDRVNGYTASLRAAFPLTLQPGQSLISTESHPTAAGCTHPDGWGQYDYTGDCSRSILKRAQVLMAVSAPVADGTFRPPYVGTSRPVYTTAQVHWDRLPKLALVTGVPTLATIERNFERPWLDHKDGWSGAYIHPTESMLNYGREITNISGQGALMLTLNYTNTQLQTLVYRYIQLGIDLYGMLLNGRTWSADGGHSSGRKLPILVTGWLLDNAGMLGIGPAYNDDTFAEDCQTGYNGGTPTYGIRYCQNGTFDQSYFSVNQPTWPAEALTALIFGLKARWDHNAFFDFVDANHSSGAAWVNNMWTAYRNNLPSGISENRKPGTENRWGRMPVRYDPLTAALVMPQAGSLRVCDCRGNMILQADRAGAVDARHLAAGVYGYRLRTDGAELAGKIIILK